MADTVTPNINLIKPEVGASPDTWGDKLNGNFDKIDTAVKANADAIAGKLNADASNVGDATAQAAFRNAIGAISASDVPTPTIASQGEAEAGSNNTNFMTPLRTAQAIAANPPTNIDASAITSGTLPIARGGTGETTVAGMRGIYTGTNSGETNYPIGTTIYVRGGSGTVDNIKLNGSSTIYRPNNAAQQFSFSLQSGNATALAGTWRFRGITGNEAGGIGLWQRVA